MRIIMIVLVILTGFTVLAGCSKVESSASRGYKSAGVAEVSGTITFDGKPLPYAQIQFSENETLGSSYSYGVTDAKGRYQMRVDSRRTGSLPGDKIVRVWTTKRGIDFDPLMQGEYLDKEIIPVQYNRESTQKITVESGKRQTFNFDLKSEGKVDSAPALSFGEGEE